MRRLNHRDARRSQLVNGRVHVVRPDDQDDGGVAGRRVDPVHSPGRLHDPEAEAESVERDLDMRANIAVSAMPV